MSHPALPIVGDQLKYCSYCLTPNTRPQGVFLESGYCVPCSVVLQTTQIDFVTRFEELRAAIGAVSGQPEGRWDCIVGVSGGKDSTRQALWVRERLGLNPLLVSVTYPHRHLSEVGARNLANLVDLGFDCVSLGPAPLLSRKLVRYAFLNFGNWCKATEMALFAGVPRIALDLGVRLILWGENPALQVGDQGTLGRTIWDGDELRNSNTLAGGNLDWFELVAGDRRLLNMYQFPSREELTIHGVHTLYLGPAWEDWTNTNNAAIAILHGFECRNDTPDNTGDLYGAEMVDEDWTIVNNLLKYYKFGFSRGTEQANSLIRSGLISRKEGVELATRLDPACSDRYIDSFCSYIDITKEVFWQTVYNVTDRQLFDVGQWGRPRPLFTPGRDMALGSRASK